MPLLPLAIAAVVSSATLLFLVQPMFARMALPMFGGSPQVWVTCMVFFQMVLLLGYGYSHWLTNRASLKAQVGIHGLVLFLPLLALPITINPAITPSESIYPEIWFLWLLTIAVGLPFFAVSTTGPLLQRWFSFSAHQHARDPYFLYAASNIGSIAGLLAYPFILERALSLPAQSQFWMYGYWLLIVLSLVFALGAIKYGDGIKLKHPKLSSAKTPISRKRAVRWIALAFVPSSLMLGVTTHITTEIAVVPLLWVIPLILYLLSFTLVFARRNLLSWSLLARVMPILALVLMLLIVSGTNKPVAMTLSIHLGFFFVAALVCHGRLAKDRPEVESLTLFYLMMALGGALGGVFNALVSPLIFNSIAEYPIAIVLACVFGLTKQGIEPLGVKLSDGLPALGIAAVMLLLWLFVTPLSRLAGMGAAEFDTLRTGLVVALPLIGCYLLVDSPTRFALALGVWCFLGLNIYENTRGNLLFADRSFFGVHRVNNHGEQDARILRHGFTAHGMQKNDPALRSTATTYYHSTGPAGQVFSAFGSRLTQVGIVGLGAGTLACYAGENSRFTYFEIDPVVIDIAQNSELFTFLSDAKKRKAGINIRTGDARKTLEMEPAGSFDLLIIDAFTNDAIPVHLMTREAVELYFTRLKPDGLLLLHVSNEHLDVKRPLSDLAQNLGLFSIFQDNAVETQQQKIEGKFHSQWILMVRDRQVLNPLGEQANRWRILEPTGEPIWTDDYSNIVGLLLASRS